MRRLAPLCSLLAVLASALAPAGALAQRGRGATQSGPATGRLVVICESEGAEVFVDEQRVGTVPLEPQDLAAGEHTVRVTRPGFTEFTDVVTLRRGQVTELEVELMAVSTVVRVTTTPAGAQVFVDGRFQGEAPLDLELAEGEHSVRIRRQGYQEVIRALRVGAGQQRSLVVELQPLDPDDDPSRIYADPKSWYERPWAWLAIGGGAVAVAVAVALVVVATGGPTEIEAFCAGGAYPCAVVRQP